MLEHHAYQDQPQNPNVRTFHVQIKDICTDKLNNSIRLGDTLLHDDDARKQLDECVFKEPLASKLDAPSTTDGLCERGGVDVDLVKCDDVFLVVCGRRLDLIKDFWEGVRDGSCPGWHRCERRRTREETR